MTRQRANALFCDHALARRLEQAEAATTQEYVAARAGLKPDAGCQSQAIGDGIALFAGTRSPINRVVALGMEHPVDQDMIDACASFFAEQGELARIDLCPLAHPSLLLMAQQGRYTVVQFKHVLVRSLADWPNLTWRGSGIEIAQVPTAEATIWAQTVACAFHGGVPNAVDLEIALPNPYKVDTLCFLARIEAVPVGGGALAMQGGVAICYSTSVRPEVRRMGVQSALLHARLTYAAEQGCDLVMVQTTTGSASQRNVERFGFQIAYTKPTVMRPVPG